MRNTDYEVRKTESVSAGIQKSLEKVPDPFLESGQMYDKDYIKCNSNVNKKRYKSVSKKQACSLDGKVE